MCEHCSSNSKHSIAGHNVHQYWDMFRRHEEWRLRICIDLQARLLLNLCDHKITPDTKIRKNKELCKTIWSSSGLDFDYDRRFGSVLRVKYADRAQSLLEEAKRWGAFICGGAGGRVYHWDTTVIQGHFNSEYDVKRWIENHRRQARARHQRGPERSRFQRVSWADRIGNPSLSRQYPPSLVGNAALQGHVPVSAPTTPTTPRTFDISSPFGFSPHTPTSPAPTSAMQLVDEWMMGEEAVDEMMNKMRLSPQSLPPPPRSVHRTFGALLSPQTPSRFSLPAHSIAPIPFKLSSSPGLSSNHATSLPALPQQQPAPLAKVSRPLAMDLATPSGPPERNRCAAAGFPFQENDTAGVDPTYSRPAAVGRGMMSQVPEPVPRESTPLAERLIRQYRRTQGVAVQNQPALAVGPEAATLTVQNGLVNPPLTSPQSPSLAPKPQPKFHFGLAPMDICSQESNNYQQPSVKDEKEGL